MDFFFVLCLNSSTLGPMMIRGGGNNNSNHKLAYFVRLRRTLSNNLQNSLYSLSWLPLQLYSIVTAYTCHCFPFSTVAAVAVAFIFLIFTFSSQFTFPHFLYNGCVDLVGRFGAHMVRFCWRYFRTECEYLMANEWSVPVYGMART